MSDTQLPEDQKSLARLYQETIDHHRAFLDRLHEAFNKRCEAIGTESKKKIAELPEEKKANRKQILTQEQKDLDKTLEELKYAITKSNADARNKLEEIQAKIEEKSVDIESELANL